MKIQAEDLREINELFNIIIKLIAWWELLSAEAFSIKGGKMEGGMKFACQAAFACDGVVEARGEAFLWLNWVVKWLDDFIWGWKMWR